MTEDRGRAREETEREAERRESSEERLAVRFASFVLGLDRWEDVVVVAAGDEVGLETVADSEAAAARARMGLRGA